MKDSDLDKLCNTNSNKLIDCYISFINQFKKYDSSKNKIKQDILSRFKTQILIIIDNLNDNQNNELVKYYCFVKDKIDLLKYTINLEDKKIMERCSQDGGAKEPQLIENETVLETIRKYLSVREEEKKLLEKYLLLLN